MEALLLLIIVFFTISIIIVKKIIKFMYHYRIWKATGKINKKNRK